MSLTESEPSETQDQKQVVGSNNNNNNKQQNQLPSGPCLPQIVPPQQVVSQYQNWPSLQTKKRTEIVTSTPKKTAVSQTWPTLEGIK